MTYPDSVQFLYSLGNEIKTAKLGLDRVAALLAELDHPERGRWIHVAGTNGKGSTCAMIESALRLSGLRTGLYTSPHLVEPTERIQVAGVPVTHEQFTTAFDVVHKAAVRLIDRGALEDHPSYFETATAMAFVLFRESGVELGVIEVGLGGRLDATNVIQPELCVITPIDFDHENILGNSISVIAAEKAGILKHNVPAVFAHQRPEAHEILLAAAARTQATVIDAMEWQITDLATDRRGSRFTARHDETAIPIECNLAGRHQADNALAATLALREMGLDARAIHEGIRGAKWPGRLERVRDHPEIILDGAHNPAGVRALAEYLSEFFTDRKVWLVYGSMRDKSVGEIGEVLAPLVSEVVLTMPDSPRALDPEALRGAFPHKSVRTTKNLRQALEIIREAAPDDAVFITGSLFLVGEARALLLPPR